MTDLRAIPVAVGMLLDQPCHQVGQSRSYLRRQAGPRWRVAERLLRFSSEQIHLPRLLPRADIGFVCFGMVPCPILVARNPRIR